MNLTQTIYLSLAKPRLIDKMITDKCHVIIDIFICTITMYEATDKASAP